MTYLNNIQINCNIFCIAPIKILQKRFYTKLAKVFFVAITIEIEFHDCVVLCDLTNFDRIWKSTFKLFFRLQREAFLYPFIVDWVFCPLCWELFVSRQKRTFNNPSFAPRCQHIFYSVHVWFFSPLFSSEIFILFIGFIFFRRFLFIRSVSAGNFYSQSITEPVKFPSNVDSDQRFVIY